MRLDKKQVEDYIIKTEEEDYGRVVGINELVAAFPYTGFSVDGKRKRRAALKRILFETSMGASPSLDRFTAPVEAGEYTASELEEEPLSGGKLYSPEDYRVKAEGNTFLLTCAQNNTDLNMPFFRTLLSMQEHLDAQLHISRFTYNKGAYKGGVKPDTDSQTDYDDVWFDENILPYASDQSLELAPGLVWCGELNIIPTREYPTTGFDRYGRGASIIIPHVKMQLKSIPTMKHDDARFSYTTGTVTMRNYLERAAGQKASFDHVYGALLVEVDEAGQWWVHQLNADRDGGVYWKDTYYGPDGSATEGHQAAVMSHGDIHGYKLSSRVLDAASEVVDYVRPKVQTFNDILDFMPANHHNIKDPHHHHTMHCMDKASVEGEFDYAARYVVDILFREYSKHYVITSNHDQAIEGWLRNIAGFSDPVNMEFWLEANLYSATCRRMGEKPRPFAKYMKEALVDAMPPHASPYFAEIVDEDESLVIDGIQHGLHGHLGPNGARGNPKNLRTVGKATTMHTHSCGIIGGVYTGGVYGNLDMGYNKGLSSWSHSFVLQYPSSKRGVFTFKKGASGRLTAWRV